MADLIIPLTIVVDSVATDADSTPTLSDSAATFGVKRLDDNTVVVAAGTVMTHAGTGVYSYTVSSVVAGITYAWSIKYVLNTAVYYLAGSRAVPAVNVTGYYAAQSDVEDLGGITNVETYSDLENAGSAIPHGFYWH